MLTLMQILLMRHLVVLQKPLQSGKARLEAERKAAAEASQDAATQDASTPQAVLLFHMGPRF